MKKGLIKAGVLLLLFFGALGGTAAFINRNKTVGTREMKDASLPIVYMEVDERLVNPMYGYAEEMEQQYMRDSLTPLPATRELTMMLNPMESKIDSVYGRWNYSGGDWENSKFAGGRGKAEGRIQAGNPHSDESGIYTAV